MNAPLSWNRIPKLTSNRVQRLTKPALPRQNSENGPCTLYGNGRSYGDVCLTDNGTLLQTRELDRFIDFDPTQGIIQCQPGVTLGEILALVVPQGWFLPVTPGTRYATVGGAIANDVHGKNHHSMGSFGHHVKAIELARSDGERFTCSTTENEPWFRATIGGLGLTGLIASATLQLSRIQNPWMWVESHRFANLDEFWELNRELEAQWPYTVAWVDCLAAGRSRGRGVLYAACHAPAQPITPAPFKERSRSIPFELPVSLVNNASLWAFNQLYYHKPVNPGGELTHYVPYFYPLDAIRHWNRIYGKAGFYQYQCVLPPETAPDALSELLKIIACYRQGSFLAVLKTFGNQSPVGMLSFPRPGATLALDFPDRGARTQRLFEVLDRVISEAGGALYPAKDARMPGWLFRQGYPYWETFSGFIDPQLTSHFWKRVTQ